MNEYDHLAGPLTDIVRSAGISDATVEIIGTASVGANRSTLFLHIAYRSQPSGAATKAVAHIGTTEGGMSATGEAQLLRLAANANVPVPRVIAAADRWGDDSINVLITSHVDGLAVPRKILRSLPDDAAGDVLAEGCGAALARVHQVPVDSLALDRLDENAPHEHYTRSLDDRLNDLSTHHPAIRWGINWLRQNPPSRPAALGLVHADFRNGNMLVDDGRLAAVLDWELAHIGDPMEDLSWMCVRMWRFGIDHRPCGGFGSVEALRRGYETAGGVWRDDAFRWWLAARSAWWAIGLARQGAAYRSGESTSIVHAASGRRVPELEYDLLTLIRTQEH